MGRKSEVGNIMLPVEHWWQKNESQRGETNSSAKFELQRLHNYIRI